MNVVAAGNETAAGPPGAGSPFPLTALQRSMVLASLRAPYSGAYILQYIAELAEEVDIPLLRRAWQDVVKRHPAVRTRFEISGESGPRQFELDRHETDWEEVDWTTLPDETAVSEFKKFLDRDASRGFDFAGGPPIRFTHIRKSPQNHTVVMTLHHAVCDGRSYFILLREWFALYDAGRRGEPVRLPAPATFRGHVQWLDKQDRTKSKEYWSHALAGVSQTANFMVDHVHAADGWPQPGVAKESVRLTEEESNRILRFADKTGVNLHTLAQAAWALMLSRYSGRREIVFGDTRNGRRSLPAEAANTVGLIVNTLPFRIDVDGREDVLSWLREIRGRWRELGAHEHTPLDRIAEWAGLPAGSPPFDTVMLYDHEPIGDVAFREAGAFPSRTFSWRQGTDTALTVGVYASPVVTLGITCDLSRFSRRTVVGMLGHLRTLLEAFAGQPDARLADLDILTPGERSWLLDECNSTAAEFPRSICAHRLFEQQVARTPDKPAVEHSGGSLTYRELNERANRLANLLRIKTVVPGGLIAVCLHRSPDAVMSALAILKAGAAFLPLHPGLPGERIAAMLRDAGVKLVISKGPIASKLAVWDGESIRLDQLEDNLAPQPADNLPDFSGAASLAYAIYTSGSTGQPKAIGISHRSLVNHTLGASRAFGISESDRRLAFAAPGADVFVAEMFNFLCHGATLVYGLSDEGSSMQEFLRLLDERRITITGMPSTWWREWVLLLDSGRAELPSSLRAVVVGMERVDPSTFQMWRRAAGGRLRWFNAYGPAETTPTATIYEARTSEFESHAFIPIGKPIANTRVYVLDSAGNPVPAGVQGELYIGGEGVGIGYLNRPDLTAQRFLPDRFKPGPGARLYRTGDIVFFLPDGNLVYVCRQDRQIKIRGHRIELDEIEAVLSRHETVDHCAVVAVGEPGREILVAYLSLSDNAAVPTPADFRAYLGRNLPEHMVPSGYEILPRLPRTASGKIDRTALPPYDRATEQPTGKIQPPSTPTEHRLAAIWKDILQIAVVDTSANFFELGGDSLLATRLITAIDEHFGVEIPLAALLGAPTLTRLAAVLDEGPAADSVLHDTAALPLQPRGIGVPFFCIAATPGAPYAFRHLARRLGEDQPFYALANPQRVGARPEPVENLARRACRAIRAASPKGPYALGGYCFGGVVAAEAARQLASEGADVRLLALFDTPAPGYPKLSRGGARYWRELRSRLDRRFRAENGGGQQDLSGFVNTVSRLLWRKAAGGAQRGLLRSGARFAVRPHHDILNLSERSARMYVPKPIPCPVVQFVAKDDHVSTRVLDDPRLGWRDVSPHGFEVCEVPGTHGVLLEARLAADLAGPLSQVLNRSDR